MQTVQPYLNQNKRYTRISKGSMLLSSHNSGVFTCFHSKTSPGGSIQSASTYLPFGWHPSTEHLSESSRSPARLQLLNSAIAMLQDALDIFLNAHPVSPRKTARHNDTLWKELNFKDWNQQGKQHMRISRTCLLFGRLSLELHVQGVASQILVELPQFEQLRSVTHVLLCVVAAHATTRTPRTGNTIAHHLSLLGAFQDHQLSTLLRGFAVRCH